MNIFELVGKIVLDGADKADKELQELNKNVKDVSKTLTVMGGAITASMGMMVRAFAIAGSELHDLSQKTGVSVKSLAGLKYAAEQSGASLGTIEMAIRRTSSALIDAKEGSGEVSKAFDRMGISIKELEGLSVEDQFLKIAIAIAEIPDPMTRAATAVDLFGRSGTEMLPILADGAEGLKKMMAEGVKLTGWTDEETKLADELGDAFHKLKTSMTGIYNLVGSQLAPILKDLTNILIGVISKTREWASIHPELTKFITLTTGAVGVLLTVFGGLMWTLPSIIKHFTAFTGILKASALAGTALGASLAGGGLIFLIGALSVALVLATYNILTYKNNITDTVTAQKDLTSKLEEGRNAFMDYVAKQKANMPVIEAAKVSLDYFASSTKASKVAIAEASFELNGFRYTTQLFSEEEMKAAEAVGALVTRIDPEYIEAQRKAIQATEDAERALKELEDEQKRLTEQFEDLITQINYADSDAGKLGVTMYDIYDALDDLGWSVDDIRAKWNEWGEDIGSVEKALKDLGMTAEDVQKKIAKGIKSTKRPEVTTEITPGGAIVGTGYSEQMVNIPEEGIYGTRAELWAKGFLDEWLNERIRYWAPDFSSYQHGGIIREDTLLMGLKSMRPYAMAHEGETISPKGGQTANIIVMLDGKTIARAIGQPLIDEIRVRTGAKI